MDKFSSLADPPQFTDTLAYTPLYPFLADHLTRIEAIHCPGARISRRTMRGFRGPFIDPHSTDGIPSLWLKPDSPTRAGAFRDERSGARGSLLDLAAHLGVNPRLGMIPAHLRRKLLRAPAGPSRRTWPDVLRSMRERGAAQ